MEKHEICSSVISLENEVEFLKENNLSYLSRKRQLNKLYLQLKSISTLEKEHENEDDSQYMAFDGH
jgi:hypothetical protein